MHPVSLQVSQGSLLAEEDASFMNTVGTLRLGCAFVFIHAFVAWDSHAQTGQYASIQGTIRDATTGRPVENVNVFLQGGFAGFCLVAHSQHRDYHRLSAVHILEAPGPGRGDSLATEPAKELFRFVAPFFQGSVSGEQL